MSQLICHSKNSITSQSKQHDIHFILVLNEACDPSYSFSIHVLNEARDPPAAKTQQSILIHSIFLSYFNFISLQSYCSFIQFFHALAAFYCHQEQQHFSKRDICYRYSTVMTSS